MSEQQLVRQCAPTLAGIKTGSLFTCPMGSWSVLLGQLRSWNGVFRKKGLRLLPLRVKNRRVLLYLYRPKLLARDLQSPEAAELLKSCGYAPLDGTSCLPMLIRRLKYSPKFPHEIGLFLGYPPEDVRGFMECGARRCKCTGCWKVYGDEAAAVRRFCQYKACTEIYCRQLARGVPIERLTVAL